MSLDVHVMPIWKFKAGDFASPLEKLGLPVLISTPDATYEHTRPGLLAKWKAKRATRALKKEIESQLARPLPWNDHGPVACSEQSPGFEPLRAYAAWLDLRNIFPTFDSPPENNYYNHPALAHKTSRPSTFPQLVEHSCYSGYFLPADFDRILHVETHHVAYLTFHNSVGSVPRLLQELHQLAAILHCDEHYAYEKFDPLANIKSAFAQLYAIAKISNKTNLPIIFDG